MVRTMTPDRLAKIIADALEDPEGPGLASEFATYVRRHKTTTGSEMVTVDFGHEQFNITITKARK